MCARHAPTVSCASSSPGIVDVTRATNRVALQWYLFHLNEGQTRVNTVMGCTRFEEGALEGPLKGGGLKIYLTLASTKERTV